MNKKYLIISAIILFVIITIVVIALAMRSSVTKNTNQEIQDTEQAVSLPTGIEQRKDTFVEDINNSDKIKNSYDKYIGQDYKKFKYYEADGISDPYAPSDKDANLVPIDTFLDSIDANINSKVKNIIGTNYYGLFYCINKEKQKEYGVVFDLNDKDPAKTKSNLNNAGDAMVNWEPYLLKDMHNILFPVDKLDETDVNKSLIFRDGKYRYAEVNLPSGKNSINYKVVGDSLNLIIIATSQDCITKAIGLFEALD